MHGTSPSPSPLPGRLPAPPAPRDPLLGRVLADRYRVLRRIGEGGMGTVYLGEHVVLRRGVALKVLRAELAHDTEIVERFRQEAVAASQIGQENVVEVLDFGQTEEGALYYVMEALDGRSLGAVLREEGPLAVPRALALLEQICRALGAAHARGVVHRDLKPENVFVVRRDDGVEAAKLLDFGISKVDPVGDGERLTRAGAIIGTPEYMAPEQAAGTAVDHRADVYALGVMAYELLTGALPLEGDTAIATLVAHQTLPPEAPSRRRAALPPEVDAVVLRALAKRPEDRFDSMAALGAELARIRVRLAGRTTDPLPGAAVAPPRGAGPPRITRGETVALAPDGPEARATSPRARRRALAGAAALALVLAAAGAAGWWIRGARDALRGQAPGPFPRAADAADAAASADPAVRAPQADAVPAAAPPPEPAAAAPGPDATSAAARPAPPDAPPAAAAPGAGPAKPERERAAPRKAREGAALDKDPYDPGRELKPDPFR